MVKFTFLVLFTTLSLITWTLSYDPATCIECRKSHMCKSPNCFCCRDEMPLGNHNIPQMVFFTFDDAVTPQVADYYRELFDSKRKNPNGCPISMTLFISHSNTVYRLVREFYDKGMEIASHSVTHSHPNSETFKREAKKQRENLAKKARIPESEIVGWRSPFLEPLGDTQPSVLKELGYEYDATLTITKKGNNDKAVTPFTLDHGWPYDCKIKTCPTKSHKGFWEVPVISVKDYLNKYDCVYVDGCNNPPPSENLAYKFLWDNFQGYYKGNRAPMGINMHASWFYYPDRKAAMNRFIKELVKLDDVYILSVKQVLAWLKHPTPLHQIKTFKPWLCVSGAKTASSNNISLKQRKGTRTLDNNKIHQKMAEQRNQWRREQLQRQRYHMASLQNGAAIQLAQPQNSMQPPLRPGLIGGRAPIPAGPPVPIIPPVAPNHPMINFWWRPPGRVLPRQVRHELDVRRNVGLHQMEHQRRHEALARQRNELERQQELEAQRQAKEQQRLKLLEGQQKQQRMRQDPPKLRKTIVQTKPKITELNELKTKNRSKDYRKTEHEGTKAKHLLVVGHSHQSKSSGNIDLGQAQSVAKSNKSTGLTDSGMLVEYLHDDASTNPSPAVQKVDIAMHRPPLREVHERKMIKHKLKLQPEIVKKDHIQNEIGAKSSVPMDDGQGLPTDNGNNLMVTGIQGQNDPHNSMHSSNTEFRHNTEVNEQLVVKPQVEKHRSDNSKNSFNNNHRKNNVNMHNDSGKKPKSPNIKLLDKILKLKPSERITYLHGLSLEDLKSLQSELRKRLASDPTPPKQSTTHSVDDTFHTAENSITDNTSLLTTPDAPTYDQRSESVTLTQTKSNGQSLLMSNNIAKSLTHASTSPITKSSSDMLTDFTVPGGYAGEIFAPDNFTDSIMTIGNEMTTTAQVVKEMAATYDNKVDIIADVGTKLPTTTEAPTQTTGYIIQTERKTTTIIPETTTEPYIQETTETSPTDQLGGKSLWHISDIFDMNNRMNGENAKSPLLKSPPKSKKFSSLIPTKSTSISLFSVNDPNTIDPSLDPVQKSLQVNLNQLGIDPTQFQNFKQKSTIIAKSVSRPAVYSKSLFKVNGFDASDSFVPNVNGFKSDKSKASLSIPYTFPTETARLITEGRRQSDKNENSVAISSDSLLTISHASKLLQTPEITTPSTTPIPMTTTTPMKPSLAKLMVNKNIRQLVKPMYLFQNNFNTFTRDNQTPPRPENNQAPIPATVPQDSAIDALSLSPLPSETGALVQEPEYLALVASSHTPGSVCNQGTNCFLPDCVCKSDTTPNNLISKQIPQIVYLTIDGSLNFNTYSKLRQLFSSKRTNPNGCPIKGTLFMTDAGSNYRIVDLLHSNGHEIGLSGLSSRTQSSAEELENNIVSLTQQITSSTGVSPIDIKGWRSPGFKPIGDSQFDILRNYSLYDSSLVIHRQGGQPKLWPFTLDFGWNEDCKHDACPSRDHSGVMEVPVIPYVSPDNTTTCEYTDACAKQPASEKETFDYLMRNFNTYYKTNRAPFAIRLKQIWFHWYYKSNLKGLTKFLDKILANKDVYVTSVSNMLDWVKDPTPLSQLDSFQPWKC